MNLLFIVLIALPSLASALSQIDILNDFYNSTGGDFWYVKTGWKTATNPCDYFGVQCDYNGRIVGIFLQCNNLSGTIPSSFGFLAQIEAFDFSSNQIYDSLPQTLINMKGLYAIGMKENKLNGSFPNHLAENHELEYIHLDFNKITGTIQQSFSKLKKLKVLTVTNNQLSGQFPQSLFELKNLQMIMLGGNQLEGQIPSRLHQLRQLEVLDISRNSFSGSLPNEFGYMNKLTELCIFGNNFEESVPSSLSDAPILAVLDVSRNKFNSFPSRLSSLRSSNSKIFLLNMTNNQFRSQIPETFNGDSSANLIDLSNNPFQCPIPEWAQYTNATCQKDKYMIQQNQMQKSQIMQNNNLQLLVNDRNEQINSSQSVDVKYSKNKQVNQDGRVEIVYYGMSKCPDCYSLEQQLRLIPEVLSPYYTLQLGFVGNVFNDYPTGIFTPHGQGEAIGNQAELCAYKLAHEEQIKFNQNRNHLNISQESNIDMKSQTGLNDESDDEGKARTKWLRYTECTGSKMSEIPTRTKSCAEEIGFKWDEFKQCIIQHGREYLIQSVQDAKQRGAVWSPTLFINGKLECLWNLYPCSVPAGAPDISKKICDLYTGQRTKPSICD